MVQQRGKYHLRFDYIVDVFFKIFGDGNPID
jgi:hypothetical protein